MTAYRRGPRPGDLEPQETTLLYQGDCSTVDALTGSARERILSILAAPGCAPVADRTLVLHRRAIVHGAKLQQEVRAYVRACVKSNAAAPFHSAVEREAWRSTLRDLSAEEAVWSEFCAELLADAEGWL